MKPRGRSKGSIAGDEYALPRGGKPDPPEEAGFLPGYRVGTGFSPE
jgi:hypothetical protein